MLQCLFEWENNIGGVQMKKTVIIGLITFLLLGIGYSAGIGYYAEKFQANTTFGSVDISNLTLVEAQEKIEADIQDESITILENGVELGTFTMDELNAQVNTEAILEVSYNSQDPTQWITSFFDSVEYDNVLMNHVVIDDLSVEEALTTIGLNNESRTAAIDAYIDYREGSGYVVEEEKAGNQLDLEQVKNLILEGIQQGNSSVEIKTAYLAPEVTKEDEKIVTVMDQIEKMSNTKITLTIAGNSVTIPRENILEWMYFDGNNEIVFDENLIHEYLGELNEAYATFDDYRQFQSTMQGEVEVAPGTLGWSIDRESETQSITADLYAGEDVTREPTIVGTGYNSENNDDIGNSYVEVDMTNQTMFVYVDGKQVISTPIVTGQIGTDTVAGAYSVWAKDTDTSLKGFNPWTNVDYEQPVDYWIPFDDTGQGIHDANWQSSFGGDAYLTNGSLGCINTPPGTMPQVFEHVTLGMPVVVF